MSGLEDNANRAISIRAYANILHFADVTGIEGMNELLWCDC